MPTTSGICFHKSFIDKFMVTHKKTGATSEAVFFEGKTTGSVFVVNELCDITVNEDKTGFTTGNGINFTFLENLTK